MLNNQRVSAWLQSIQFLQSPKFWPSDHRENHRTKTSLREYPDELWENLVIYGDDIDDTQTFAPKVSCGWEHGHFKRWPVDGMGWPILWHRNQWLLSLSVTYTYIYISTSSYLVSVECIIGIWWLERPTTIANSVVCRENTLQEWVPSNGRLSKAIKITGSTWGTQWNVNRGFFLSPWAVDL